jgi:serine/threonine protein phosphatase PrpC
VLQSTDRAATGSASRPLFILGDLSMHDDSRSGTPAPAWQPLSPGRVHRLPYGTAFGATDVGLVRTGNEDNFLIDEALGLVMVADGMGGHDGGEIASAGALTAVLQFLQQALRDHGDLAAALAAQSQDTLIAGNTDPDATWTDDTVPAIGLLYDAIEFANQSLSAKNLLRQMADGTGMGTTLTGCWQPAGAAAENGPLIVFQVGDSRLYRLRGTEFVQLTRDQTLYQQAIDAGILDDLPKRNVLLQAVGPYEHIRPVIEAHQVEAGDLFMLCSDGLYGSVAHAEMDSVLRGATIDTATTVCQRLIAMAKAEGGPDNITVVLVFAGQE